MELAKARRLLAGPITFCRLIVENPFPLVLGFTTQPALSLGSLVRLKKRVMQTGHSQGSFPTGFGSIRMSLPGRLCGHFEEELIGANTLFCGEFEDCRGWGTLCVLLSQIRLEEILASWSQGDGDHSPVYLLLWCEKWILSHEVKKEVIQAIPHWHPYEEVLTPTLQLFSLEEPNIFLVWIVRFFKVMPS